MTCLRILSWNIRQGGGRRLRDITQAIERHGPDVVALNETRSRTEPQLVAALSDIGLPFVISSGPKGRENGILVASRFPLDVGNSLEPCRLVPHGLLDVTVRGCALTIGAMYGPMLSPAHDAFWAAMVRHAEGRVRDRYLLIGDFNSGESLIDTEGYEFTRCDQFVAIRSLGFVDAWRAEHGDAREYSWFSFGRGNVRLNGFRLDHALASPALAEHVRACRYSHSEREGRLSDHSILLLEYDAPEA